MLANKCKIFFPISRLYIPTVSTETRPKHERNMTETGPKQDQNRTEMGPKQDQNRTKYKKDMIGHNMNQLVQFKCFLNPKQK